MLSGTLVIEQFGFALFDVELPEINVATGAPTGRTVLRKVLQIKPDPRSAAIVEIRMTEDDLRLFIETISKAHIVPATQADIARLNGGGGGILSP